MFSQEYKILNLFTCLCIYILLPSAWCVQRSAVVEIYNDKSTRSENVVTDRTPLHFYGIYASAGPIRNVEGMLRKLADSNDEMDGGDSDSEWVGLFHYPYDLEPGDNVRCQTVMDKVKKALLLGASAIIILALNPSVMKELDLGQLLTRPVIIVQAAENVTALLDALLGHLLRAKVWPSVSSNDSLQKVTFWARCTRYKPGSGVVCFDEGQFSSKMDPGQYWTDFYSAFSALMLLLLLKALGRSSDQEPADLIEAWRLELAGKALASLKLRRYPGKRRSKGGDTCAICLDSFVAKQVIRTLPCVHEFHSACVDPWLLRSHTCPLCKRSVLDCLSEPVAGGH